MARRRDKKLKGKGPLIDRLDMGTKTQDRITKKKRKKKAKKINASSMFSSGPSSAFAMNINVPSVPSFAFTHDSIAIVSASSTFTFPTTSNRANEWKNKEKESDVSNSGFIFICNGNTKAECYRYRVFGLPMGKLEIVKKIKSGMKLFLFDVDLKLLYGIYTATSNGALDLEPTTFNGKFPAQVRFNIFKDCLPLRESAFKHAIKENYQGGPKFRQELSGKQVKTLISLFRPINVPSPISSASPLPNVAAPQSFWTSIVEEGDQPPTRLPPLEDSYSSGLYHSHTWPVFDTQTKQAVPRPLYNHNELELHMGRVQSTVEPHQVVQQASLYYHTNSNYLQELHQPYLPDKPFIFPQEPHGRDQIVGYGTEHHMSQLPMENKIVPCSDYFADYYSQHLPHAAVSHVTLQAHALAPSSALPPSAHPQAGLYANP